ncbi:MAG: NAD-dependent epimerase/dehydratase family protein [Chitinophagaceae bacterium]
MTPSIIIIGSEGFIGSHLVEYFTEKGWQVHGADILSQSKACSQYYQVDPQNARYTAAFTNHQFEYCIFAGGNGSVPLSVGKPFFDYEMNVYNVAKLLEDIRLYNQNCKFIHLSSAAVYGNPGYLPIDEKHPVQPVSPYGWHKYLAENLCLEYFQLHHIAGISLRIFSVYGERLRKQLFWDTYHKYLENAAEVTLFGDGTESRDFIYITDICKAVDVVMANAVFDGGVINVANGEETTIKQAVELFLAKIDGQCKVSFNNITKEGDPKNWKADIHKLKALGFVPGSAFEESIKNTVQWITTI